MFGGCSSNAQSHSHDLCEEITSANIRKLVAACKDLDTFALLGVGAEGSAKAE